MRYFVTVDIEGVAGVVHTEEGAKGNPEYERARRLMTAEASAVVAGIFEADAEARVTVADAHATYRNIIPEELDERAILSRGKPRTYGMVHGIERGYDAAMFVGIHAKAGSLHAALSHTFSGTILDVLINGRSLGEMGLNAALAGAYGVPVVLVSGDQAVVAEARDLFDERLVAVQVKESLAQLSVESVHPAVARTLLRAGAAEAARRLAAGTVAAALEVSAPITCEIALANPALADLAARLDDTERVDGRTVRFTRSTMPDVYRVLRLIVMLGGVPL